MAPTPPALDPRRHEMAAQKELSQDQLAQLRPDELRQLYMAKQVDFGRATQALQRRRSQRRLHVPAAEAPVASAGPNQRMIVGPELGFDIYNFHVFTSGRAGGSERYHSHGDAVKFYVAGHGYEVVGDERFEVNVGDFMHVPGNIWHGTENPHDEPLTFLAAQQFVGTFRQVPTPFVHELAPNRAPDVKDLSEDELARLEALAPLPPLPGKADGFRQSGPGDAAPPRAEAPPRPRQGRRADGVGPRPARHHGP